MSVLSAEDVAGFCHKAGFSGEALVTIVAIAKGESGFDADAVGDTGLQDETWGPSVGLLQIRSLRTEKGTDGVRDELANRDPGHNAEAGWEISGHGRSFSPWSIFSSGAYRQFVAAVRPACQSVDETVSTSPVTKTPVTPVGQEEPMLFLGSTGEAVGHLQELLDRAGFEQPGDDFRVFGSATDGAVRAYQASRGLDVDGFVGRNTWRALKTGAGRV